MTSDPSPSKTDVRYQILRAIAVPMTVGVRDVPLLPRSTQRFMSTRSPAKGTGDAFFRPYPVNSRFTRSSPFPSTAAPAAHTKR